jgi:hypothetical protein
MTTPPHAGGVFLYTAVILDLQIESGTETTMRPTLTFTLLVAAFLGTLPAYSSAEEAEQQSPAVKTQEAPPPLTKEEKAEARRLAREERAREQERERVERERLCVIKPVMTDAQIAQCKEVWR